MNATRCKVKCVGVTKKIAGGEFVYSAELHPVTSGSPENDRFYKWTPGGRFDLQTIKADCFEVGKEYFVDFTLADAAS